MPKVKETKKPEPVKPAVKEDPKVIIFRIFECVVNAEIALERLRQIGIFPQGRFVKERDIAVQAVSVLADNYRKAWGEMQNL